MKKELKIKEPVKIRVKHLSNGNKSIYLDIYMDGERKYEFLKLYIIPECSKADRERNSETLKLANSIKSPDASWNCNIRYMDSRKVKYPTSN